VIVFNINLWSLLKKKNSPLLPPSGPLKVLIYWIFASKSKDSQILIIILSLCCKVSNNLGAYYVTVIPRYFSFVSIWILVNSFRSASQILWFDNYSKPNLLILVYLLLFVLEEILFLSFFDNSIIPWSIVTMKLDFKSLLSNDSQFSLLLLIVGATYYLKIMA